MAEVYLFGGTTEARKLAYRFAACGIGSIVRVASDTGVEAMGEVPPAIDVRSGRMDAAQMAEEFAAVRPRVVVDATHPFARIVSGEIQKACKESGLCCLRLERGASEISRETVVVTDMKEAAAICDAREGNILLTTGSKEIAAFMEGLGDVSRVYARVLPEEGSIRALKECGIPSSHIIAMQGPFSAEMNVALLHMTKASVLVTKASGEGSGFEEKIEAAKQCGVQAVVIGAPETGGAEEEVYDAEALFAKVCGLLGVSPCEDVKTETAMHESEGAIREVVLAGYGPGDAALMTGEVRAALADADVIFGAARLLDGPEKVPGKAYLPYYRKEEILAYLDKHCEFTHPVVLFSGDASLFSGAKRFLQDTDGRYRFRVLPGISSIALFAARLGVPMQDAALLSMHGRQVNLVAALQRHDRVFLLTEGAAQIREIGQLLQKAEDAGVLPALTIHTGYRLSYPEEQIATHTTATLQQIREDGLYVLYMTRNGRARYPLTAGIPDEEFLRGNVPMTKEEIRVQICSLLKISHDMVFFDVGAGTGSVTVEAARLAPKAKVFAFEKDEEAIRLIRENGAKFFTGQVRVIAGEAPDTFSEVSEIPTHAFLGGSGKRMREILSALLQKNPDIRIVISAVTIETFTESVTLLKELKGTDAEVMQIAVSRAEKKGAYHMMRPLTPVWLISTGGEADG